MPYSNNGYNDSIHIVWRKGTPDDPFIDRYESLKVVNHKIVLSEVPDKFYRVRIDGMSEINYDKITKYELKEDEFIVDYASGFILFHELQEAKVMNIFYKGRGLIQYPSSRIYHQDQFNNVVVSLEEIIDRSLKSIENLNDSIDGKISEYNSIRDILLEKINNVNTATDNANLATQEARNATDLALDAYDTTRMLFKPYVLRESHIPQTYPRPEVGWVVQAYDTGVTFRWDGINWIPINLFGGNIPDASANNRGMMTAESYRQLQEVKSKVDVGKADERVVVFCFPYLQMGVNNIIARFPFKGEIQSVKGICLRNSDDSITEIDIEKSSDFTTWNSISDYNSYLTFEKNANLDNGGHRLLATGVNANDVFRVSVRTLSSNIEGVTIELKIKIIN